MQALYLLRGFIFKKVIDKDFQNNIGDEIGMNIKSVKAS